MLLYHFQTKGRDEARPRAGVLRTREFIMKDAYSFDRDEEGLDASYAKFVEAYDRICDRVGLEWYRVESDVGMMGGSGAHEYMAPCPAGRRRRAGAGLRGQRRGRKRRSASGGADRPRRRPAHAGSDDDRRRGRHARRPRRQPAQGVSGRHRVARPRHGLRARRPPRQRDQARQRARRGLPARARGRAAGPRRLPRAGARRRDAVRRRDRGRTGLRDGRQPAPTTTT